MSPSSTSSSDRRHRRGRWWWWVGLVALMLAAVEGWLRLPEVRDALPPRTHYYDRSIAVRQDALEKTLEDEGRIDVLFVGSSIVRTNVTPLMFDAVVQRTDGSAIVSFNAGLSGLWPASVALYLERLWLPAARPRVVVQGVRYPELAAGTHALRPEQVFTGTVEAGWMAAPVWTRVFASLTARVRLLQYRGALTDALERWSSGRPGTWVELAGGVPIDARGHTPRLPAMPEVRRLGLLEDEPIPSRLCPIHDCQVGLQALAQAIEASREAGATYVLLNVPEHASRWTGPEGLELYREYLAILEKFAAEQDVSFVDPTGGNPMRFANDLEYSDTYHMTPHGAARLTRLLATSMSDLHLLPRTARARAATD